MTEATPAASAPTTSTAAPATSSTPAPAASDAAPAAQPAATADTTNTPDPAAADKPADGEQDSAATESDAKDKDQADTDNPDKDSQSSEDKDAEDTDKKDDKAEESEDGNQEAKLAYEPFTLPEGIELDNEAMNEATPILQELKADQAQAQKLVDVASSMLSKAAKQMADQHNEIVNGWKKETLEQFGEGGDAQFEAKVGRAEEVVKQFFNPEQRKVLTHYGLGNHPAFFAMALAIAEGTGEDRPSLPNQGNGSKGQETLAQVWYPSQT